MAEKVSTFDLKSGYYEHAVPMRGVAYPLPIERIPADALYKGHNVVIDDGALVQRPGMTEFVGTTMTGRPTGIFTSSNLASGAFQEDAFQNNAFQVSASIPSTTLIVGTTRKIYTFYNGILNDITGTPLNAIDNQLSRFAGILIGTPPILYVLHTNGSDPMQVWDSISAVFSLLTGTPDPPIFTDMTTIDDRIVGIIPPYEIRWSPTVNINSWPLENSRMLADTRDKLVAINNFGLQGGVVYKAQSIWNVVVTGSGTESAALRFDFKKEVEGPASPAAVVNAGAHYYMTHQGRIARWDGFQHEWVADGIWPLVQADMDMTTCDRTFGAWNPTLEAISFYYPRIGDNGECKGVATVMLPNPFKGIGAHIAFTGKLERGVSAGGDSRLDSHKQYLATSTTPRVYTVEGINDAGTNFSGHFQSGLAKVPGVQPSRLGSLEVFAERGLNFGELIYKPVTSNILDNRGGSLGLPIKIDLSQVKVFDLKGVDARGRFFGSYFEFTTPITLKYKGAMLILVDRDK